MTVKLKRSSIRFFLPNLPHFPLSVLGMLMTEEREWREWQRRQRFPLHFEEERFTGPWNERTLPQYEHNKREDYFQGCFSKLSKHFVERWPHTLTLWRCKSKQLPLPPSFSCSYTPGLFVLSPSFTSLLSLFVCSSCSITPTHIFLFAFSIHHLFLAFSLRCTIDACMFPSVSPPHTMFIKMARRELLASAALVRC